MPIRYVVIQGDSVSRLAAVYGLAPETIWNDAANEALRELRNDMNILLAGDVLVIPDKNSDGRSCATGRTHVFRRKGVPMLFRVQVLENNAPRKQERYVLQVGDLRWEGTTDEDGAIEHYVPNSAVDGRLMVGGAVDVPLRFGHMDPLSTIAGVQKRLSNLGFPCGSTGTLDEATASAILAFQQLVGSDQTGELDDSTRTTIGDCHDQRSKLAEMAAKAKAAREKA